MSSKREARKKWLVGVRMRLLKIRCPARRWSWASWQSDPSTRYHSLHDTSLGTSLGNPRSGGDANLDSCGHECNNKKDRQVGRNTTIVDYGSGLGTLLTIQDSDPAWNGNEMSGAAAALASIRYRW